MKTLVIGGAGFVGHFLTSALIKGGHTVVATKLPEETFEKNGVQVLNCDVMKKEELEHLLKTEEPDWIFHLAAISSVALSWKNPDITVDVNIKGTVHLLEAMRVFSPEAKLLLVGSGEEYGHILPGECPILENNPLRPGNIYAATKVEQNLLGKIYANAYQLHVMMTRSFNHIGPGQGPIFVAADFCKQVVEIEAGQKEAVIHVGNLSAKRDFSDVEDVVSAYLLLMEKGAAGETYNVGSGKAISIDSLLQQILALSTVPIKVEVDPNKLRPVDVPIIEADCQKIAKETGWKPDIPLEITLETTLNYWREQIKP